MLDFRMETFLIACKTLNFTRTAKELHITQPAVSHHIHHIEEEYQVKLFDYKGKRLCLTEAGKRLRDAVTTIRHDDLHLRAQLKQLSKKERKMIFGATLTVGEFALPNPLACYLRQYPQVSVQMVVADTRELLKQIDTGAIDFAIVEGFFSHSEYDFLPYSRENYIAVCGAGYSFSRPVCGIEDLLEERLLLREPGSGTRRILERELEGRNLSVRDFQNTAQISNISAIKSLAAQNCGITFLYEIAARAELESGALRQIPLPDFQVTHDFSFLWRKNSLFSDYYHTIFKSLQSKPGSEI